MRGRQGRDHRHAGQKTSNREHGFDPFASRHHVERRAKKDAVAEKLAHGASRGGDRRLVARRPVEPCAMRASDLALEVGDRRDHRRPGLRGFVPGPIVTAGIEAEVFEILLR